MRLRTIQALARRQCHPPDQYKIKFGPGSHHSGVTNHLFVDGAVHTLDNKIDPALYMFLSTRDGQDPTYHFEPEVTPEPDVSGGERPK